MDQRIADLVQFKILESEANKLSAELYIDKNLPSFQGHFPGKPILPAVSIIDISLRLLSEAVPSLSYADIEVKRSKFMAVVQPEQEVVISAESEDGKSWRLLWKLKENQSKLAQVHLIV